MKRFLYVKQLSDKKKRGVVTGEAVRVRTRVCFTNTTTDEYLLDTRHKGRDHAVHFDDLSPKMNPNKGHPSDPDRLGATLIPKQLEGKPPKGHYSLAWKHLGKFHVRKVARSFTGARCGKDGVCCAACQARGAMPDDAVLDTASEEEGAGVWSPEIIKAGQSIGLNVDNCKADKKLVPLIRTFNECVPSLSPQL